MTVEQWVPVIIQLGVGGVMLFMFNQVVTGKLRTLQEMEARKELTDAERARTKRAEEQTDKLLPAMQELTAAVKQMIETHTRILVQLERDAEGAVPPRGARTRG